MIKIRYKKGASRILKNGNVEVITSISQKNGTYKSTIVSPKENLYYNCHNKKEKWFDDRWTVIYQEEA